MSTTQPIRNKNEVRELTEYYLNKGKLRNHLLIVMGIHTALRISDLLSIKWNDVYDFNRKRVRDSLSVLEQKTGKAKLVKVNTAVFLALNTCLPIALHNGYLFASQKGGAISRVQAYRIIRCAAEALDFQANVSCHSLRKSFGYHAWKSGISPAVLMEIYNHSNYSVTRRYLGVTQEDKDEAYSKLGELF